MKNRHRFTRPPHGLCRRHIRLDNISLFPGDMLPYKNIWTKIASNLPSGSSLIVLPASQSPMRPVYEAVARRMAALGKAVRLIQPDQVLR